MRNWFLNNQRRIGQLAVFLGVFVSLGLNPFLAGNPPSFAATGVSSQTDVDRAKHVVDNEGVPYLEIANVGKVRQPAWVAIYALAYAGEEVYDPKLIGQKDQAKFLAALQWLEQNLKQQSNGQWVWVYDFDNTYNDVAIKAPWSSAFAQATGIQAFLAAYRMFNDTKYLDLARRAATSLFVPFDQGGFLFQSGADIWFEEIPQPADNPSHILNGHMRVLIALKDLVDATQDETLSAWLQRGTDTLYRWLPRFDAGYWLRYDLNPKKNELLFRFANPYGFKNHALAVNRISLRDPQTKEEVVLNVGTATDASGSERIAGTHWGPPEEVAGRVSRRLLSAALDNEPDKLGPPHTYFYLSLPGEWASNLRDQWYELSFDYYDDAPANITVQQRTISPGQTFRDMRDGDLHMTGARQWRRWTVPLRPTDLGYWVGQSYAEKHAEYLRKIADWDKRFAGWAVVAKGYQGEQLGLEMARQQVASEQKPMPPQMSVLPLTSLDAEGVVMQHMADATTKWFPDGSFDPSGGIGNTVYSPYVIAEQVIHGTVLNKKYSKSDSRQAGLKWLLNPQNYSKIEDAAIYQYAFPNVYNDVETKSPWSSAFGQAYVMRALNYAQDNKIGNFEEIDSALTKVSRAYEVPVSSGGFVSQDRKEMPWYEEVPNETHVLNAHLISVADLAEFGLTKKKVELEQLSDIGVSALRDHLYQFDSGYWLRYDQNPKKQLQFQIGWLAGDLAPLIDSISLVNPQTGNFVRIDAGADQAGQSNLIEGLDWEAAVLLSETIPAKMATESAASLASSVETEKSLKSKFVRSFRNGLQLHEKIVPGGTRENVYFKMDHPEKTFSNLFDAPPLKLVITYLDRAPGQFVIRTNAIHRGDEATFVPLRSGVLNMTGDGKLKQAVITVRPQDMGWYKGPIYQEYEVKQLQRIAALKGDWFFYQYAERQRYFLDQQEKRKPIVLENIQSSVDNQIEPSVKPYVISSSRTYEGFSYENALDDDIEKTYTAGIENEPAYVELGFDKPVKLLALRFVWESEENHPNRLTVRELKESLSESKKLAEVDNLLGSKTTVPLLETGLVSKIRIDFEDFSGQPRILLRQIQIIDGSQEQSAKGEVMPQNLDAIYMEAEDARNPSRTMGSPITYRIKGLAQQLSLGAKTDHEKIIDFMDYIGRFRVGYASGASPDVTVMEQVGACGTFTGTLLALAAVEGMPGRFIGLYNYPKSSGHVVAEIFADGKWRLYDPTFAGYYLLKGREQDGPMSYEEVRDAYSQGNEKNIIKKMSVVRWGVDKFAGKEIFVSAKPAGIIGPEHPMLFPLFLDFSSQPRVRKIDYGTKFQGADFLGAASTNQNQEWTLSGLTPGLDYEFLISPDGLYGNLDEKDLTFEASVKIQGGYLSNENKLIFDFSNGPAKPRKVLFRAQQDSVKLTIEHSYTGSKLYYMTINEYAIELANHD